MEEKKTNCGIYGIFNLIDNKVYVGSSSNLKSRKYNHFKMLMQNTHYNTHLQSAFNRDGAENFKWDILEYIDKIACKKELKKCLYIRENFYISKYKSCEDYGKYGYNMCPASESPLGIKRSLETKQKLKEVHLGKTHSEETKEKISKANKGKKHSYEAKLKMSATNKGKIISKQHVESIIKANTGRIKSLEERTNISLRMKNTSEEFRNNISIRMKGNDYGKNNKGNKHSEETKEKIRKNSSIKRKIINLDTSEVFISITEAANYYKINRSHINAVCTGDRKTCGGFKWSYYEE